MEQPHHGQFVLFDVPEGIAFEFDCANRLDPVQAAEKKIPPKRYGKYFGAVFTVKAPQGQGEVVATLWTRQQRFWKLVAYEVEAEPDPLALEGTGRLVAERFVSRVVSAR